MTAQKVVITGAKFNTALRKYCEALDKPYTISDGIRFIQVFLDDRRLYVDKRDGKVYRQSGEKRSHVSIGSIFPET